MLEKQQLLRQSKAKFIISSARKKDPSTLFLYITLGWWRSSPSSALLFYFEAPQLGTLGAVVSNRPLIPPWGIVMSYSRCYSTHTYSRVINKILTRIATFKMYSRIDPDSRCSRGRNELLVVRHTKSLFIVKFLILCAYTVQSSIKI